MNLAQRAEYVKATIRRSLACGITDRADAERYIAAIDVCPEVIEHPLIRMLYGEPNSMDAPKGLLKSYDGRGAEKQRSVRKSRGARFYSSAGYN